jgi:hypothetical protein
VTISAEEFVIIGDNDREEVEAAWAAEIQRRAADARANPHDEIDWRDAIRDVNEKCWVGEDRVRSD